MNNQEGKNTSRFYPKNLKKFKSNMNYCICRSSWEVKVCNFLDSNEQVVAWNSEQISIPYFDKVKQKERRYFPDFLVKVIDKDTKRERVYLIEIKPYSQCIPPTTKGNKSKKTILYEHVTYQNNKDKWISAQKYCKNHGIIFKLITERELNL